VRPRSAQPPLAPLTTRLLYSIHAPSDADRLQTARLHDEPSATLRVLFPRPTLPPQDRLYATLVVDC
jgi:hypothetical protein